MDSVPIQLALPLLESSGPLKICSKCARALPLSAYYIKVKATGRRMADCRDCHNAGSIAYYATHKEQHNRVARERRQRDPARARAKDRAKNARTRPQLLVRRRAWHALPANKAKTKAYHKAHADQERAYYHAHAKCFIARAGAWNKAHPDAAAVYTRNRRARLAKAPGRFTPAEWQHVKERQDYTCLDCGQREPAIKLSIDHIIPLSKGGSNDIANIAGRCQPCNSRKGARLP